MRKQSLLKLTAIGFVLAFLASACIPESDVKTVGDSKGKTFIKFYPAEFSVTALSPISDPQTAVILEVRRDVQTKAELNKTTNVTLKFDWDTTMINAYNAKNEMDFVQMPYDLYTIEPAPDANHLISLDFAAGEFSKVIKVTVPNALDFDFAQKYAMGFKIESVTGEGTLSANVLDTIICQVMAKNKFDGIYEVTAITPMLDVVNAAFTGYYPFKYYLITTGLWTNICIDMTVWGDAMHPMSNAGATSGYGSFGLELEFDADGNIVAVYNPWGNPPANTRMPVIDPSGVNKWDEATGNIKFKYWMIQPSLVPTPPNIRVYFDEMWTFKGQR
jgi:hypothetical protein